MVRTITTLIIKTRYLGLASAAFVATMLLPCHVLAQEDANANPHWNKNRCQDCHVEAAPVDGAVNLQAADAETLCGTCHGGRGEALPCRHISGIEVGSVDVPDPLRQSLKDGTIVCSTCHDVVYQCKHPDRPHSFMNPAFLNGRTSLEAGDFCVKCHDASGYQKLNPHKGVAGVPTRPTCELCHASIPQTTTTGQIAVTFNMEKDLNDACTGCHEVRPHPSSIYSVNSTAADEWVHLVTPSDEILTNIRQSEREEGIVLPLNPVNGEIFCATCHDPHEFKGGPVAQQPAHRLRADDICQACHEK